MKLKPTAWLASFSFFLLVAFTTASEVVFDSDGDMMRNGGKYMLSPQEGNAGDGGVMAGPIFYQVPGGLWDCSIAVTQNIYFDIGYVTVMASTVNEPFITTTMPLYPYFDYLPQFVCRTNTSSWVVIRSPDSPPFWQAVMVGNGREEFGDAFVSGWFNIKPYDSARRLYKLVFCLENGVCRDIGSLQVQNRSIKRFVLTLTQPLVFKFDKADSFVPNLSMVV